MPANMADVRALKLRPQAGSYDTNRGFVGRGEASTDDMEDAVVVRVDTLLPQAVDPHRR